MVIDEMKKRKGILVVSHNADALRSHFDREIDLN
jgi:ABC-type Mn2+/Zn2+ transport system ATPase subunit